MQQKYAKAAEDYVKALVLLKTSDDLARKENNVTLIKDIVTYLSKVHQLYGQALYYTYDFSNSLITLNQGLDLNENNSYALYYRGLIYYAQNELSKSIKDFDQALKVIPDYRYYYANGRANYLDKNYVFAIDNYSRDSVTIGMRYLKICIWDDQLSFTCEQLSAAFKYQYFFNVWPQ